MNKDYFALASEVTELEEILKSIPQDNVIERMAFEERLDAAKLALESLPSQQHRQKAILTFRGRPVLGSRGIAADFGGKAAGVFADAFASVVAGLNESLRYMGPIPDKEKNQLLITGTATGSFGFEFELPVKDEQLFPEFDKTEEALERIQTLLQLSAEGSDDEVTELVDEIHPRAVKKVSEFLTYLNQQNAWCGLEFKNQYFRYRDIEQLESSIARLQESNIHESEEEYIGEFQGVLPMSRNFEFKLSDQKNILKGKLGISIEDPDILNREWLHKPVRVKFHVIQVGQGRPRYTLSDINNVVPIGISN